MRCGTRRSALSGSIRSENERAEELAAGEFAELDGAFVGRMGVADVRLDQYVSAVIGRPGPLLRPGVAAQLELVVLLAQLDRRFTQLSSALNQSASDLPQVSAAEQVVRRD